MQTNTRSTISLLWKQFRTLAPESSDWLGKKRKNSRTQIVKYGGESSTCLNLPKTIFDTIFNPAGMYEFDFFSLYTYITLHEFWVMEFYNL